MASASSSSEGGGGVAAMEDVYGVVDTRIELPEAAALKKEMEDKTEKMSFEFEGLEEERMKECRWLSQLNRSIDSRRKDVFAMTRKLGPEQPNYGTDSVLARLNGDLAAATERLVHINLRQYALRESKDTLLKEYNVKFAYLLKEYKAGKTRDTEIAELRALVHESLQKIVAATTQAPGTPTMPTRDKICSHCKIKIVQVAWKDSKPILPNTYGCIHCGGAYCASCIETVGKDKLIKQFNTCFGTDVFCLECAERHIKAQNLGYQ